ncbi:MAG: cysteine desulfurase [Marinibacterium sp.]|nr:cysteine desulfurase [Marinibacterium sp.]
MSRAYLDWNATAPLRAEARAAMIAAMDLGGNPSSVHAEGRKAKALVERARGQVADLVGCQPRDVIFTSGATEAAGLALPDGAVMHGGAIEHDAVGAWIDRTGGALLDVDGDGRLTGTVGGAPLADHIAGGVVALQAANSETGVMQDTLALAQQLWALQRDVFVLVDAVQAIGKSGFTMDRSGADFILVSAHKFGGPKGIGALIAKPGIDITPRIPGGGQEMGRRSGTENIIGIAGFGAAAEAARRDIQDGIWARVEKLRNILDITIAAASSDTIFVGKSAHRLPNTTCFATPGWKGETQVMQMDLAGFAISAGSACSSGKVRASKVLTAMGYDEGIASSAIRVSLGRDTTEEDVLRFAEAWDKQRKKQRARAA